MKTRLFIITILVGLLTLTSCKSKEEKAIDKLSSLSERIEKHGDDYDAEEWQKALEELANIHQEMQNCKFTQEQLTQLGIIEGRLSAVIANKGAKALGRSIPDYINNIGTFISGFKDGMEENIDMKEIKNASDEISNMLNDLDENLQ